jgi:hypothetical protein
MSEFGIISPLGVASIARLVDQVRNLDVSLPPAARLALLEMAEQIDVLSDRIEHLDDQIREGRRGRSAPGQHSGRRPADRRNHPGDRQRH